MNWLYAWSILYQKTFTFFNLWVFSNTPKYSYGKSQQLEFLASLNAKHKTGRHKELLVPLHVYNISAFLFRCRHAQENVWLGKSFWDIKTKDAYINKWVLTLVLVLKQWGLFLYTHHTGMFWPIWQTVKFCIVLCAKAQWQMCKGRAENWGNPQ